MAARYKSVETKYVEARDRTLRALRGLDRRIFFKVSAASAGAAFAKGLAPPHSFQLVEVASAAVDKNWAQTGAQGKPPFTFVSCAVPSKLSKMSMLSTRSLTSSYSAATSHSSGARTRCGSTPKSSRKSKLRSK